MAKAKKSALPTGCDLCDGKENHGPLFLHARCHMTAPLQASMEHGILTLRCYIPECGRVVARFQVTDIVPSVAEQIANRKGGDGA